MSNLAEIIDSGAQFSGDRIYRYSLWRTWNNNDEFMMFVGLNPSTADETEDDPTIRRCMGFAKREGFGGITMLNLFAYRSTDPKRLRDIGIEPIGKENNHFLDMYGCASGIIVVAWGNHGKIDGRAKEVIELLSPYGLWCFGVTKQGQPKHPLYLSSETKLSLFKPSWR